MDACRKRPIPVANSLFNYFQANQAGANQAVPRPRKRTRVEVDAVEQVEAVAVVRPQEYPCAGFRPFDDFARMYPFRIKEVIHRPLAWEVFEDHVKAVSCQRTVLEPNSSCQKCLDLSNSTDMKVIVERAQKSGAGELSGVQRPFWNMTQLNQCIDNVISGKDRLRLDNYNAEKTIYRLRSKLALHKTILMLISQQDVKRLRQVLNVVLKNGGSLDAVYASLQRAIDGVYSAKQYNDRDLDLAFLVLALGGPKLLFALNQSYCGRH